MSYLEALKKEKIIAVLRHVPFDKVLQTANALQDGGIKFLEVTMNSERAGDSINSLRCKYENKKEMIIGAGTVLNIKMAQQAVDAGAQFLISPNLDLSVVDYAVKNGIDIWPGVMSPTEIVNAWQAGANAVKVFPAGLLGPKYIKAIKAPLDNVPIIATGGIDIEMQNQYFKAGVVALGLGSQLVSDQLIAEGRFSKIKSLAHSVVKTIDHNG